jgi:short-subunit dehydrogenase
VTAIIFIKIWGEKLIMLRHGVRKEMAALSGIAALLFLLNGHKRTAKNLGLLALLLRVWPGEKRDYFGKTVVITGGSRGLGFAMAKRYAKEGAQVVLLARDGEELDRAWGLIKKQYPYASVHTMVCDITQNHQVETTIDKIRHDFGRIDVLINNAGSITVGPISTLEKSDYKSSLKLHLFAVLELVRFAKPLLKGGQIVNISSVGGRIPVPHMSSYSVAKHALSALSEGLQAELEPDGIRVTTVYPGLMRTGSPIQALFKGNHEKEYAWFALSDNLPGLTICAEKAANIIFKGVQEGNAVIRFPKRTALGIALHALMPETYASLNQLACRVLPNGDSTKRQSGAESKTWLERQLWYKPLLMVENRTRQSMNQSEKVHTDKQHQIEKNHHSNGHRENGDTEKGPIEKSGADHN